MSRLLPILVLTAVASAQEVNPDSRLAHATEALRPFLSTESNIPKGLTAKAQCVIVAPRLEKGAFLLGAKFGRGFASCRLANGNWSAPAAIAIEGGTLAGSATDLILLVMNQDGMTRLMGDKFTLSGQPEVLSYSRTKVLFEEVSVTGATLRPDSSENKKLYGHEVGNDQILQGKAPPPRGARAFVALLNKHARKAK